MNTAGHTPTFNTTKIGYICQYTLGLPPSSAFIHGDLWRSFWVLDRCDLGPLKHVGKYFGKLMVMQVKSTEICQQMNIHIISKFYVSLMPNN